MDAGWKDKVFKTAYCDGAAQDTIMNLKFKTKTVPFNFRIDEDVKKEFTELCERMEFAPSDVLRQLVDSFCDRIHLMEGPGDRRMTPEQQERFAVEVKHDGQVMLNVVQRHKDEPEAQ